MPSRIPLSRPAASAPAAGETAVRTRLPVVLALALAAAAAGCSTSSATPSTSSPMVPSGSSSVTTSAAVPASSTATSAATPSGKPAGSAKFPASLDGYTGQGTDLSFQYSKDSDATDTYTVMALKVAIDYGSYVKALYAGKATVVGKATCGEVVNSPVKGAITCTLPLAGGLVEVISPGSKTAQQVGTFANDLYATFPG